MRSAHLVYAYLRQTENWLHRRILGLKRYRPIVLAPTTVNESEYHFPGVRSYSALGMYERALCLLPIRPIHGYRRRHASYFWKVMTQEPCEVLHSHFGQVARDNVDLRLAAKRKFGLRTLTSFYGWDLGSLLNGNPQHARELFDSEDGFIVEGPHMAGRLRDAGCRPEKLFVNSLGIDLSQLPFKRRNNTSELLLLTVGRFVEKKGIPDAIRAVRAARLMGARVKLSIVGDGPDRAIVERIIEEGNCNDFVTLHGALNYDRLIELYYSHDLLLQPSRTAANGDTEGGAPVCLIEAMASGLPIVATRHADIPFVAAENENALLADEGDIDQLARAIRRLADDPSLRLRFAEKGRNRAVADFDAKIQSARLEEIYDHVLGIRPMTLVLNEKQVLKELKSA